jgi:hypothetical protein
VQNSVAKMGAISVQLFFGRNFAGESRFQATQAASAYTFSWPRGHLPHFSAKFRRKCFRAFSIASGRNLLKR